MLWFFLLSYLTLHYCCISFLWCIHASRTLSLCSFAQTFDNVRFIDPVQNGVWGSDNFYCKGVESGVASGNTFPIPPCFANKTSNWMKTFYYTGCPSRNCLVRLRGLKITRGTEVHHETYLGTNIKKDCYILHSCILYTVMYNKV